MPETPQTFYLTTPIYYVNARPHIGHAYTTIVADVLARRHRLLGDATYFLTGTDEHGQKIERSAAAAGVPPQQFADKISAEFSSLWSRMGITHDQFIRTTSDAHARGVQKLFTTLYEKGHIYLASYTGSYCVSDEAFIDAPVGTPCPDCGRLLEEITEENFFFKLSAFQSQLIDLIESNTLLITPDSSRNEVLSFLRSGLKDLSISRSSFIWGIPVPEPAASTAAQKHVIYVWLDALANYMTALGYGSDDHTLFDKFWPADLHLVGKEITRFHCIYWPAFLLAAGLPLPKQITAHGWLLFDNSKMSKSKGNIVRTETILQAFGTLCPPPLGLSSFAAGGGSASPEPAPVLTASADRKGPASAGPQDAPALKVPASAGPQGAPALKGPASAGPQDAPAWKGPASAGPQDAPVLKGTGFSPSVQSPVVEGALAPEGDRASLKGTASAVPQTSLHNETALAAEGVLTPTPHDRDLFAADVLRYYLLREIPFGQDGSFSFEALITRYNADLANGYGNLVSRTLNMIQRYFDGKIPSSVTAEAIVEQKSIISGYESEIPYTDEGHEVHYQSEGQALGRAFSRDLDRLRFARAFEALWLFVGLIDGEISAQVPWKIFPDFGESEAFERRGRILYLAAESIRIITALLYPILPYATARVWAQLGLGDIELAAQNGQLKDLQWGGLQPGTKLGPLGPIFPRADKGLAQLMNDLENPSNLNPSNLTPVQTPSQDSSSPAAPPRTSTLPEPALTVAGSHAHTTGPDQAPSIPSTLNPEPSSFITIDDFAKIDLRVAQIVLAERIPKADKLLRLEVDLGPLGRRQILSGIAEFYTPEELTGRRIVVIANLAPRKMRGLESHGMLLAASDPEAGDGGKPHLATCGEDIPLGARLK